MIQNTFIKVIPTYIYYPCCYLRHPLIRRFYQWSCSWTGSCLLCTPDRYSGVGLFLELFADDGSVSDTSSMRSYAFGQWILQDEVLQDAAGRAVHLPPKELAVLSLLLDANGALISKDVLLDNVWPDCDVAEESLTRCIYSLRKLLGDNKDYIVTVYGKGDRK